MNKMIQLAMTAERFTSYTKALVIYENECRTRGRANNKEATEQVIDILSDGQWHAFSELEKIDITQARLNFILDNVLAAEDRINGITFICIPDDRTPTEVPEEMHTEETPKIRGKIQLLIYRNINKINEMRKAEMSWQDISREIGVSREAVRSFRNRAASGEIDCELRYF